MSPDNDLEREILQLEQRYAENAHGLVFAHLADAYRRAGQYSKAEGLLLHGLKTHPTYTSAYNVLGRVYVDSERYADAQTQFARALELDPQNLISLRALGDLAARRGLADDARVWYERMLQIDPRSEEARDGLARLTAEVPEPAVPETAEVEAPDDVPPPSPIEEPEPEPEVAAAEGLVGPSEAVPDEPMMPEVEEPTLETVEKVEAEIERVEGLIGDQEMSGFTPDSIYPEAEPEETTSYSELEEAEPWVVEAVPDSVENDLVAPQDSAAAGGYEPWSEGSAESGEEVVDEPEAEAMADFVAEPAVDEEMLSLELPSMDDWSPGFVVGELLEGQAVEDLRPEEILEGLDAEISFDDIEEPTDEEDADRVTAAERRGEGPVTETMAELYASQGLYSDALVVYRQLAAARPEDEQLETRIVDLERRMEEAALRDSEEEDLVKLMRLTEPEEEAAVSADFDEPASEHEAEVFEFEDESPVAGFEHLDPFAASFDAVAAKTEPGEPLLAEETPSLGEEPGEAEAAAAEPVELDWADVEAVPVESLAEEPEDEEMASSLEGPEGEYPTLGPLAGESAAEVVAEEVTDEIEYPTHDEGITAVDSIWELTEVGASIGEAVPDQGIDEGDEESEVPVRFVTRGETAESEEASTMEDYLGALLTFDVESLFKKNVNPAGSPADDEPPPSPKPSKAEDLEQFQEWLRSLKR